MYAGARAARSWVEAVAAGGAATLEQRVAVRLGEQGGPARDATVAARLVAAGHDAAEIAVRLGVTTRTLHRRSLAAYRYGPRTLGRVLRPQRVLPLLDAGLPLAEVAQRAGYADQPHLPREVRALAGRSPARPAADRAAG
ncbi:helix-turn-helix domain-containing protein [Cellulosimicrobium cellulans]|uniref:helix-turn-helix domain-containing protein n=1 Tax=Cellulosimicrobium cellulans TaxID=1710 RepID=UPI00130D7F87|nr:helix-turn-helix domain-containing protein [Cellulosimicrobium cellulans]